MFPFLPSLKLSFHTKVTLVSVILNLILFAVFYITFLRKENVTELIEDKVKKFKYLYLEESDITLEDDSEKKKNIRQKFKEIYNVKFPPSEPDFLVNPYTGKQLELDGLNEEIGIGFIYNNKDFYDSEKYKNYEQFTMNIFSNNLKKKLCEQNNIKLVQISYKVSDDKLRDYIIKSVENTK